MGAVWGRGALDMKGTAIVELMTMIALKRRGVPLSRDVILVANADEETSSTGAEWFTREKKALLRDAEFLLNEGGHNRLGPEGRTEYYGVGVTEKVPYWLRLTARGAPGHGSIPRPDNASERIARALGRIAAYQTPIKLTPPAERYFKDLATREHDPLRRRWLADPAAAVRNAAALRWLTANPYYNAILRNTISITVLRGSDKTNVIPPEASAELDVRLLPGERPADFVAELRRVIADSLVEITPLRPEREATTSPLDGALIEAIRERGAGDGAGRAHHHADARRVHGQLLLPRARHRGLRPEPVPAQRGGRPHGPRQRRAGDGRESGVRGGVLLSGVERGGAVDSAYAVTTLA